MESTNRTIDNHSLRLLITRLRHLFQSHLVSSRWALVALGGLISLSLAVRLLAPQVLRQFIDAAVGSPPNARLVSLALTFAGLTLAAQGAAMGATYIAERVSWQATNLLRSRLVRHALQLDGSFHHETSPGQLIEQIDGDATALSNVFSRFVFDVLGNSVLVIGILTVLSREDWRIAAAVLLFALAMQIVVLQIRRWAVPHTVAYRQAVAAYHGFLTEAVTAIEDLRPNGATGFVLKRQASFAARLLPLRYRANAGYFGMWAANAILFTLGVAAAMAVGAALFLSSAITIGTVYLVLHYAEMLRSPLAEIRLQFADLQQADASTRRITQLLEATSHISDTGTLQIPQGPVGVQFDRVSVAYPSRGKGSGDPLPVLRDVSFTLNPGEILGVLGRTGSGKTTLARALVRLVDPTQGHIRLGRDETTTLSIANVRQAVRMVPQETFILRASVRENIRLFEKDISDNQLTEILHHLGLLEWVEQLPDGLDTQLAGLRSLSAGQAQVLSLARAFIPDPQVIILDEVSSRLDPRTEAFLDRGVSRLLAGRTGIVIAHRLSTVARAGHILILQQGAPLEMGNRLDLAADPSSHFSRLLRTGLGEVLA